MSEFFGSTSFDFNVHEYSSDFRPLDEIGYPNYLISIDGFCINTFTGNEAAIDSKFGSYILRHPFSINAPLVKFPQQYLVKIAWWNADLFLIIDSPYRDWILQYREYQLLPPEDKVVLPYRNTTSGYILTKYGDVWSMRYMNKMIPQVGHTGYAHVTFNKENSNLDLQRLVAEYFIEIPEEYLKMGYTKDTLYVNHIDGNKTNNRWDNLEWITPSGNTTHAVRTGLYSVSVSDEVLREIWRLLSEGLPDIGISKRLNIPATTISNIRHQQADRYKTDEFDWPGKNDCSDELKDKYKILIDAYNSGLELLEIANKYNTSEATIRRAFKKFPELVHFRKYDAKKRNKVMKKEELEEIFQMLEQGYNNADIAKKVMRPITNIRDIRVRKNFAKESEGRIWPMNPNVPQVKDPEWIKKVMDLYTKGMSGLAISKTLDGISHDNVLRIIRDNK